MACCVRSAGPSWPVLTDSSTLPRGTSWSCSQVVWWSPQVGARATWLVMQVLERLDPDGKYYEGKRGACIGFVQQLIVKHKNASSGQLPEVLAMLKDSADPSAADIVATLETFAAASGFLR